jgi:hypothetical protein
MRVLRVSPARAYPSGRERFSLARMVKATGRVYEEALGRPRP